MKKRDLAERATELAKTREPIPGLQNEREQVQGASAAEADLEPRIDRLLDALQNERRWLSIMVPTICAPENEEGWNPRAPTLHPDDVLGLLAQVAREPLRALLLEQARQHLQKFGPGLPAPERATRIAAIDAELWRLERQEERLIEDAEAHGIVLDRRGDADPRAVLFVEPTEVAA